MLRNSATIKYPPGRSRTESGGSLLFSHSQRVQCGQEKLPKRINALQSMRRYSPILLHESYAHLVVCHRERREGPMHSGTPAQAPSFPCTTSYDASQIRTPSKIFLVKLALSTVFHVEHSANFASVPLR